MQSPKQNGNTNYQGAENTLCGMHIWRSWGVGLTRRPNLPSFCTALQRRNQCRIVCDGIVIGVRADATGSGDQGVGSSCSLTPPSMRTLCPIKKTVIYCMCLILADPFFIVLFSFLIKCLLASFLRFVLETHCRLIYYPLLPVTFIRSFDHSTTRVNDSSIPSNRALWCIQIDTSTSYQLKSGINADQVHV